LYKGFLISAIFIFGFPLVVDAESLASDADGVSIKFREKSVIDNKNIELGEIAQIQGGTQEKVELLTHLILDEAPADEAIVRWSSQEISRKLRIFKNTLTNAALTIPKMIEIRRHTQDSTEKINKAIQDSLAGLLPSKSWSVEIDHLSLTEKIKLYSGDTILVEAMTLRPHGKTKFSFKIASFKTGIESEKLIAEGNVKYFSDCATLEAAAPQRTPLSSANISWMKREVTSLTDIPATKDEVENAVLRYALPKGSILLHSAIEREMAIRFGEEIKLIANNESFNISSKGTSQQNGFIGDLIKVRASGSQKMLNAVVVSKGLVRVDY
jgi:flagella basal body P-ring formation protein FlgA